MKIKEIHFLRGAFQIFDDDWHDYVPIFGAAGTKYVISKVKLKRVSKALEKHFFFFFGHCLLRH
jgi:hypothetical protein